MGKAHKRGNTLAEYAVIGSMVAMVAIMGLSLMGGNLNDWLQGLKGELAAKKEAAFTASTRAKQNAQLRADANAQARQEAKQLAAPQTADQICLNPGNCVSAPLQGATQTVVQTSGGNGSQQTQANAIMIEQLAAQYAASENPYPTLSEWLTKLANYSHDMSRGQYGLEEQSMKDGYKMDQDTAAAYRPAISTALTNVRNARRWVDKWVNYVDANPGKGYSPITPEMKAKINAATTQIEASGYQYKKYTDYVYSVSSSDNVNADGTLNTRLIKNHSDKLNNDFLIHNPQSGKTQTSANTVCAQGGKNCTKEGRN